MQSPDSKETPAHPSFGEALRFWLKLGFISFGGPTGQIAIMHAELVEKRRWISEARFLHALNYCMLLPGPEAQQLATYIGWLLHRTWGGIAAGALFVIPSAIILWVLSWVYVTYGAVPWIAAIFYGLKPVVLAIVASAVIRIGKRALRNPLLWTVALGSLAAIRFLNVPFPVILAGAALVGLAGVRVMSATIAVPESHFPKGRGKKVPNRTQTDRSEPVPPLALRKSGGTTGACPPERVVRRRESSEIVGDIPFGNRDYTHESVGDEPRPVIGDNDMTGSASRIEGPQWARAIRVSITCLALWWLPVLAIAIIAGTSHVLFKQAIFFSKAAMVTFGGAYAVLPYVSQQAVETHHWLSAPQMLDGLALAETTPGPLIMVLQFVGFVGAWNHPGNMSPLAAATLGALITTWTTFVPCFLWVFLGAPYIERLRGNDRISAMLTAVTAAVVGVILNLAIWFGAHTVFPSGRVDWFAVVVALVAFVGIAKWKWDVIPVIAGCGAAGWAWVTLLA
jgi:chromate transporter